MPESNMEANQNALVSKFLCFGASSMSAEPHFNTPFRFSNGVGDNYQLTELTLVKTRPFSYACQSVAQVGIHKMAAPFETDGGMKMR